MLVENMKAVEEDYFSNRNEMVVPDLLCSYYEKGKYELTYYLAKEHMRQFGQADFYYMMSLMEMGYFAQANPLYQQNKGEWFNLCKQNKIYWKHVALFALYFNDYEISDYYVEEFDSHYDDCLIQLLEIALEAKKADILKTDLFQKVADNYPLFYALWRVEQGKEQREVITFEKIQWNIWKKQNAKIGNGKKYGIEQVYEKESLRIYSYKPKEVAASMHIITDGETTILLDCGCEISDTEIVRIPVKEILNYLEIKGVDAVFISHAHMDHYGSLNELRKHKVVMTLTTRQLIRYAAPEIALDTVESVEALEHYEVDGVCVNFIPNGHIRGSVMLDINWKEQLRIVYTGDYTVESQRTVQGFQVEALLAANPKKIDVLLTETTYGDKTQMLKLREYENMFVELCRKQFENGNKIIIPCFAIGRAQEVALLLSQMAKETGAKILIDGLAAKVTEYYQLSMRKDILNRNISICHSEFDYSEKILNHDIILASSGMMKEGSTCAKYIEKLIECEKVCVMKVGFIHKDEHLLVSIVNRRNKNINYVDIPLSAHAGYQSLVETTQRLSPDCVIYVHGGGILK